MNTLVLLSVIFLPLGISSCSTTLKNPLKVQAGMTENHVLALEGKPQHSFNEESALIYIYERAEIVCVVVFDVDGKNAKEPECRRHANLNSDRKEIMSYLVEEASERATSSKLPPESGDCTGSHPIADADCTYRCEDGRWIQRCD